MLLTVSAPRQRKNYDEHAARMKLDNQREAVHRKVAELGAAVVGEFVIPKISDWTDSARFRRMVEMISAEHIDFVLTYPISLHRSHWHDAVTYAAINRAGAELVSCQGGRMAPMPPPEDVRGIAAWLNHAQHTRAAA